MDSEKPQQKHTPKTQNETPQQQKNTQVWLCSNTLTPQMLIPQKSLLWLRSVQHCVFQSQTGSHRLPSEAEHAPPRQLLPLQLPSRLCAPWPAGEQENNSEFVPCAKAGTAASDCSKPA